MRSLVRGLLALSLCVFGTTACGGGGGGSSPSAVLPSTANASIAGTSSSSVIATPAPAASATIAPGTYTIAVVDYFTNQPIGGATVALDTVTTTQTGTSAGVIPSSGLHALTVTAPGYATFNGALQAPGGQTARTIALMPVTPLMSAWLARVNADRAANGRNAVVLDDMLSIAAYDHAVDMGTRGYFAHFDTHGFAPTTRSLMLGSMMMAAENIAAGYSSWSSTEDAFMAERTLLPNPTADGCVQDPGSAGHYCDIVWAGHTHVGLAVANVPGSKYGTYYDQEFGDFYGRYDGSVLASMTAGLAYDLGFSAANNAVPQSQGVGLLPLPVPISTAVLNADPICASQCPADDGWYPRAVSTIPGTAGAHFSALGGQLTFVGFNTSQITYVGASAWALVWPSPGVAGDSYKNPSNVVSTQSTDRRSDESAARIAPNPPMPNRL